MVDTLRVRIRNPANVCPSSPGNYSIVTISNKYIGVPVITFYMPWIDVDYKALIGSSGNITTATSRYQSD